MSGRAVSDRFLRFHLWNLDLIAGATHCYIILNFTLWKTSDNLILRPAVFAKNLEIIAVTTSIQSTLLKILVWNVSLWSINSSFFIKPVKCRLIWSLFLFHCITNRDSCHICNCGWSCVSWMTLKHSYINSCHWQIISEPSWDCEWSHCFVKFHKTD